MQEFKFVVESPQTGNGDESVGYVRITASYPIFVYPCQMNRYKSMDNDEHVRLAIAELKMRLIAEIASAEFVYETR